MMGIKKRTFTPGQDVSLDALVPTNHFYRHVERTIDLSFVRDLVAAQYAARGRPSIDPVVFFKLQLVMFFEGIRSERLLLRVVADQLSARWYVGYDLGEALPDHSSLTRIRERYGVAVFRDFFETIVAQCRQAGLVWGRELYADATKVRANASYTSYRPRFYVEAHLRTLFGDPGSGDKSAGVTAPPTLGLDLPALPAGVPASATDELAAVNAARHEWLAACGRPPRDLPTPSLRCTADYSVSTTDSDATFMHHKDGGPHLGYQTHYVVDGGKARIILSTLVTPAETMENEPFLDLLRHTLFRWQLQPRHVTGDKSYGTADIIAALERANIRAYVPLPRPNSRKGLYYQDAFVYDAVRDVYICPQGSCLHRRQILMTQRIIRYQADAAICAVCPCKARCTTSDQGRSLQRSFEEEFIDRVRAYHETAAYKKAMRKRGVWVEPLFAEAKAWHGLRRFRLRRLEQVNMEALLTATGQNLKRLLGGTGWGRRPYPGSAYGLALRLSAVSIIP
jgi:transposase